MGLFDKLNEKIDSFLPSGKKKSSSSDDKAEALRSAPKKEESVQSSPSGETQEIIDGNLFVDGVNVGPVKSGAMSGKEDVLNILGIPDNYTIPDRVLLPKDLANVKFPDSSDGFEKNSVAEFYDGTQETIEWFVDTLSKRNEDIAKLADYIDGLNEELQDKEMEAELQKSSGLNIIAGGGDKQQLMNAKLKIRKLTAEVNDLRSKTSDSDASDKMKELSKRYDDIQDQLAMEQYENKQLRQQLSDMKTAHDFNAESTSVGFAESMQAFDTPERKPRKVMPKAVSPERTREPQKQQKLAPQRQLPKRGLSSKKSLRPHAASQNQPVPRKQTPQKPPRMPQEDMDVFSGQAPFDDLTDQIMNDDIDLSFDD